MNDQLKNVKHSFKVGDIVCLIAEPNIHYKVAFLDGPNILGLLNDDVLGEQIGYGNAEFYTTVSKLSRILE